MNDHVEYILHGGPSSLLGEQLSFLRSHKQEFAHTLLRSIFKNRRKEPKVFCLNAGNCGSKYLVHLLESNDIDRCYHEKDPDLDYAGVHFFLTGENGGWLRAVLMLTRNDVYLESSNRLFSLSPLLKEVFPNSRFIHLHRDGRDVVRSSVNKVLWPEIMEEATRLRYTSRLAGDPELPPFERTCHYWANINKRILKDLESMDSEDVLSLKFQDLIQGNIGELEAFLGDRLETRTIDPVNTKDELKSKEAEVIGDCEEWPEEWKHSFSRICGPVQRRMGYES